MKRLVLVDGNALLHRAYHATPPLSTSKGLLVNAVFGFTSIFLKALDNLKPDYVVVAWDKRAPTFRHEQYEHYKATRKQADDALVNQYEIVDKVLKSLDVPEFSLPGFEADDLIGALAKQAEKKDLETIILTGDRDIMQLINKNTKVLMPRKTINDVGLYGEEEFALRFGFEPKQLIEYKGLAGDQSDNIPGVSGIGEVTATKLIQKYQNLEGVYNHLEDLPERMRNLLEAGREQALMSRKLATIECEVPINLDLEKSKIHSFDKEEAKKVFEELEFKSLISRIPGINERHPGASETSDKQSLRPNGLRISNKVDSIGRQGDLQNDDEESDSEAEKNSVTAKLDQEVEPVLKKMSEVGVLIDLKFLSKFGEELKRRLANIDKEIYSIVGHEFNLNSPKQLSIILFDELNLPVIKKTKTGRSTDESTLRELYDAHPIIPLLLEYRQLFKLISTYIDALPKHVGSDKRVHSTFNVEGAATGRLSSQDPNLQNIPIRGELGSEIRKAFVASKGKVLLGADYSQIELRIMAHLTDDPNLKNAFTKGEDIHAATAAKIFDIPINEINKEQRAVGKTMNFATLYGQGARALSQQLKISFAQARDYIDEYFNEFPRVKHWMSQTLLEATKKGYAETLWGRRRYFPELQAGNRMLRSFGERAAVNHPVQGTAADMIKKAMVEIDRELVIRNSSTRSNKKQETSKREASDECRMILQVHDELLFECDPESVEETAKLVKEKMENALKLSVPVVAELKVGPNWGEMKPLKLDH